MGLFHKVKRVNAKIHLKLICPICPRRRWRLRDLEHNDTCFWRENWRHGNIENLPIWMGWKNFFRLLILRKPMVITIEGKRYVGKR